MKKTILIIVSAFMLSSLFAQGDKKNKIYLTAAPTMVLYEHNGNVEGGGSYDGKRGYFLGLEYSREVFKDFELLTGIHYANNKVKHEGVYYGQQKDVFKGSFHLNYISIPLQAKYHFTNFFFVNGGGILNFKVSSIDPNYYSYEKDKFGLLFGLGGKIDIKDKYCLIVNPYFQMNFLGSDRYMNFYNLGVKIGLGYKF